MIKESGIPKKFISLRLAGAIGIIASALVLLGLLPGALLDLSTY